MRLRRNEMFDVSDEWSLVTTFPDKDEHGRVTGSDHHLVADGTWLRPSGYPLWYAKLTPGEQKVSERGPSFQIILLEEEATSR
jgi:hypothetical protein